ncbi:MAG: hypothetical protein HY617_02185 [Candidatus Sungbacteria bacterium]|nr:hypothetical protein [Candidatus Sungbacteria bacterium]
MIKKQENRIPSISLKSFLTAVTFILFAALTIWWIMLLFLGNEEQNLIWAASYQAVALWGGISGLFIISRLWGGLKSVMGRAITYFSLGLLFQVFGQSVFSFYNITLHIQIPYPSFADIGFFGSIPFYIYGTVLLGKASRISISLKSFRNKLQAIVIPLLLLVISYVSFLLDYQVDFSNKLRILLDFGYPIGQAIYVSIAILVYILSRNILGGIMKNKIILVLIALVVQYVADYNFLYQNLRGTWINGGYGDYIYLFSYFVMSLALVRLMGIFSENSEMS